jgi:hypothetical protein
MPDIIEPAAFTERFLYLTDGNAVQRPLREMTVDEVLRAFDWSRGEAERLEREAEPAQAMAIAFGERRREVVAGMSRDEMEAATASLSATAEAFTRHERLLRLIQAAMPLWQEHNDKGLREALCRYWPPGYA